MKRNLLVYLFVGSIAVPLLAIALNSSKFAIVDPLDPHVYASEGNRVKGLAATLGTDLVKSRDDLTIDDLRIHAMRLPLSASEHWYASGKDAWGSEYLLLRQGDAWVGVGSSGPNKIWESGLADDLVCLVSSVELKPLKPGGSAKE